MRIWCARWWGAIAACIPLLAGCGRSVELRTSFPDNLASQIEAVVARLPAPSAPREPLNTTGRPLLVTSLHGEGSGVAAFDAVSGQELWRRQLSVDSSLFLGAQLVVFRSGQRIVGLGLRDGQELWSRDMETIDFMGAAIDSGVVVLTFSTAGQRASVFREGRAVALDAATGRELWSLGPVEKQFGAPAATGGMAFLPWDRLTISVLDLTTGQELARLLSRDDVYAYVRSGPEGVFYGSSGAYRLTKRSASGAREESSVYEPLVANAPVSEGFFRDGFLGQGGGRSARNKIQFLWRGAPASGDDVRMTDDIIYFLYYRVVFAFDAATGALRWVRLVRTDVEAAEVVPGGVLLLDGEGALTGLDAEAGATVHQVALGAQLDGAAFDVPTLPSSRAASDAPSSSVREQLLEVIFDPDGRLTPARRFAVSVLASMDDEQATRDLLEVCRQRRVPENIRDDAARVLRTRQVGARFLLDALREHYDFLEAQDAPPVGVIAAAALHMRDNSSLPRLWEHMLDPETPREDLESIAQVLLEMGDASLVPGLRAFIVRYRADSEFQGSEQILVDLVRAVARYGTDADRQSLAEALDRPTTLRALLRDLDEALTPPAPEVEAEAQAPAVEVGPQELGQVMESSRARIRPCIQAALRRTPELREIRLSMLLDETGDLEELTTEPRDDILGSCLTLSLSQSRFPAGSGEQRRAEYTIRIEGD